jgi:hypothetical protein
MYDDFHGQGVAELAARIYGTDMARHCIDRGWRQQWWGLVATGWVFGAPPERVDVAPVEALAARQPRTLSRRERADNPYDPTVDLAHGTARCVVETIANTPDGPIVIVRDVSPFAGIDRTPRAGGNGVDIAYDARGADFPLDERFSYYEWRVGLTCSMRPQRAAQTAIAGAAAGTTDAAADDVWLDAHPLLAWFERWAVVGWEQRPPPAVAVQTAVTQLLRPADAGTMAIDVDAIEGRARLLRATLAAQLVGVDAGLPPNLADEVAARRAELMQHEPAAGYSDAQYAGDRARVEAVLRGIHAYGEYLTRLRAEVTTPLREQLSSAAQ